MFSIFRFQNKNRKRKSNISEVFIKKKDCVDNSSYNPKFGQIQRSKFGCAACRLRKKKCDETKPICGSCKKRGVYCIWSSIDRDSDQKKQKSDQITEDEKEAKCVSIKQIENINLASSQSEVELLTVGDHQTFFSPLKYNKEDNFVMFNTQRSLKVSFKNSDKMDDSKLYIQSTRFIILDALVQDYFKNIMTNSFETMISPTSFEYNKPSLCLAYEEENMFLKHLFEEVTPILDALNMSPWAVLTLKYCDFAIARNSFIALSSIHLYNFGRSRTEFYDRSILHVNVVIEHLLKKITWNQHVNGLLQNEISVKNEAEIILLTYIYLMYTLFESGKSKTVRHLLQSCVNSYKQILSMSYGKNELFDNSRLAFNYDDIYFLMIVISWFDTVASMVSYDCRKPFCDENWFRSGNHKFSTLDIMGCPPEIFEVMWRVCHIRYDMKHGNRSHWQEPSSIEKLENKLMKYRRYVSKYEKDQTYLTRLKCARGWSMAVHIMLLEAIKSENYLAEIDGCIHEFVGMLKELDPNEAVVNQMVWPLFLVGSRCTSADERKEWLMFIASVQSIIHTGTMENLKQLVLSSWDSGKDMGSILEEFYLSHIDYLPL